MRYKVYDNRVKIYDSYLVSKKEFAFALSWIREDYRDLPLWENRSVRSMRCEWALHVLAYNLGYKRERTKDCDLDFKSTAWMSFLYFIFGSIAMLVIK